MPSADFKFPDAAPARKEPEAQRKSRGGLIAAALLVIVVGGGGGGYVYYNNFFDRGTNPAASRAVSELAGEVELPSVPGENTK